MCYMEGRKLQVGVRELRQNLSVYLDRVKRGESLTVTEHNQVVAVLGPAPKLSPLERLVAEGRATPASQSHRDLPPTPRLRLKRPLSQILDDMREDSI